jgi:transmembrane sensor
MIWKRSRQSDPDRVAREATVWLARRDRGFEPAEQDEFMQWLAQDPSHAEVLRQHAAAFERMMTLYEWQPGQSAEPNVELFSPQPRRRWSRLKPVLLAAAAAIVVGAGIWLSSDRRPAAAVASVNYLRINERQALPDGSVVELRDGSRISVQYSASERRLVLSGEGHFTVAKDATRPFIVDTGNASVRAIGTIFNVRLGSNAVEVLVTEGRVRVEPHRLSSQAGGTADDVVPPAALVNARERAVLNPLTPLAEPSVSAVSDAEIAVMLAWKVPRLQFFDTPLATAVRQFNLHNLVQIVVADPELNSEMIGGTFAVNNVEGFVRLAEVTLDLRADWQGEQILLSRAR